MQKIHPFRRAEFYQKTSTILKLMRFRCQIYSSFRGMVINVSRLTNTMYPWDGHSELRPPKIDWDYNPVGSYVREFDLE